MNLSQLPPLEYLRALVAAADSPNLMEAGRKIGLSQPAISVQLRKLEKEVHLPIFQTDGRRKTLTPYGQKLVTAARKGLLGLERSWEETLRDVADPRWLVLRVAGRRELHPRILDRLQFAGKIHLTAMGSHEATEAVLRGEVDISVSHERPDSSQLVAKKLFSQGASLVVHRKWLKGKKTLDLEDPSFFTSIPALVYRPELPILGDWLKHLRVDSSNLRVRVICEDWTLLYQRALLGDGYTMVPEMMDGGDNPDDIFHVRMPSTVLPAMSYYAIYRPALTKMQAFREVLR
jgi:DNA-binding transcriptional LysR family regulator